MEPEGDPLTPGTSYGPPPSYSAQDSTTAPTFLDRTLQASCSPNVREELLPSRSPWPRVGDGGFEQIGSPLPREGPGSSPVPRADPGSSPMPRADPGSSPVPRADPGSSPMPRADPGSSPMPRADPGSSPMPRADPGSSPMPRADPGSSLMPRADPGSSPMPRADPGSSPMPRADPGSSLMPRADPGSSPMPRADPGSSPLPRADPGSSPMPRADPGSSPMPRADPGSSPMPRADPESSTQRRFRPSAFPSSLTWDSDSEKETLDEEELQHFSNPHGLAAHSPGSPTSGFRLDSEDYQAPEKLQHLLNESDISSPMGGRDQDDGSTKREEPNTSQLRPAESADNKVWNVSERAELSKAKPKAGHQTEGENSEGKKTQRRRDTQQPDRDVYSFPGDSDPESPPPAPWAHCTFIQRRRKKRALLRPFSGLGTWQRTSPEAGRRARMGPQRAKTTESAQAGGSGGVYDFEEAGPVGEEEEEAAKEPAEVEEESAGRGGVGERREQEEEDGEADPGKQIFTCVECSIYFKKQIHLQEHIAEHCQSGSGGGRRERLAKAGRFRCAECGWNLPNRLALADHHRRHQESREKILEEIEKLNDSGKVDDIQREESKVMESRSPDSAIVQDPSLVRVSDPDVATIPTLSPVPVSTVDPVSVLDPDPVSVVDPDPLPAPVRAPARARAVPANRRRFFCTKCDFSTRTSQALANHAKTHNRKKPAPQRASPCIQAKLPSVEPGSPSQLASTSLACGHCAFLAPSQTVLREHQNLAHPGQAAISGVWPEEMGRRSRSSVEASFSKDSDHLSASGSAPLSGPPEGQSQLGTTTAIEDSAQERQTPNSAAASPKRELAFKCIGNRRANRRGKDWTKLTRPHPTADDKEPPETEEARREGRSAQLNTGLNQKETNTPAVLKPHTRARSLLEDSSSKQQSSTSSCPPEESVNKEEGQEAEEDGKVSSTRVTAASAENDSDEDDVDVEQMRRFLSEGILDEDEDEIDEETGALKSVERKCPYCPDRFHNGIGLANHVRGHLNRVGVSYNVRHFISPEEVNAIEKKFSYQKKKKKVANFDPDTFSVMRCEFCSAGFDTRAGLSSHARAHLRDFGITNWEVTVSPIHILRELFSSRPDLVIPTAPPRSPGSQPGEDEDEEENDEEEEEEEGEDGEERREGELGGEKSEGAAGATRSNPLPSASPQRWKSERRANKPEGGEEGEDEEEEEEAQQRIPALDSLSSSLGRTGLLSSEPDRLSPGEDADTKVPDLLKCEVCGVHFETRRGLSSHARSHLRQLGIGASESSGAPIDLLYQITKERSLDGEFTPPLPRPPSDRKPSSPGASSAPQKPSPRASSAPPGASSAPQKPSPGGSSAPQKPSPGTSSAPQKPSPGGSSAPQKPSPGTSSAPQKPSPGASSAPQKPSPGGSSAPQKPSPGGSSAPQKPSPGASSAPQKPSPGGSSAPQKPSPGGSSAPQKPSPGGSSAPQKPSPGASSAPQKPSPGALSAPQKDEDFDDMEFEEKPIPLFILAKAVKPMPPSSSSTPTPSSPCASPPPPGLARSCSPSSVVRKAPISSLLPVSSPLRSPDHKPGGLKSLTSNLSAHATLTTTKPFWAPQESDAPLNLTLEVDPNKDIICQLCGAWFETRKGLSSHARAHLRHFGVEYSESKGSPIDLLNQLIHTDDFKHKAGVLQPVSPAEPRGLAATLSPAKRSLFIPSSSSSSPLLYKVAAVGGGSASKATSSSVSCLLGPPAKRSKSSSMLFRLSSGELMSLPHNEPLKEIGCEFCGEYFENRKGLSSHARSHLRQMGITEWSVNGSPIDTLREIITRRGLPCALPLRPLKTPPPSSPGPPRSPLSSSSSLLGRLPFAFARPSSPQSTVCKLSSAPASSSAGLILKLKPEPVQLEVTMPSAPGGSGGFPSELLNCSWSTSDNVFPLNLAMAHEVEPTRDIRCEFCGEYFENRKGLSSHARSHLRQMGITEWSVNGSPIDTLRDIMHKRGAGASSPPGQGVKKEASQEANSPTWDDTGGLGGLEGLGVSGYHSSKYRKSPISLLHLGSRLHKQGLGAVGLSTTPPSGKFFRVSQLGKRALSEDARPAAETAPSPSHQLKTFSPLPQDFSFKRKSSPDKHGAGHHDASCELCGFYFENRKALASHARAHLRQFGVTEWCVNGSPIETLSAWMRSRPQKVLDMHRSYMQGNRSTPKKKSCSPLSPLSDSDHLLSVSSQKPSSSSSSSQWSAVALSQVRMVSHEVSQGSSKTAEGEAGTNLLAPPPTKASHSGSSLARHSSTLPPQAQVARSELNVRLPRGFERRPLKHPSHPDGPERENGPPKPPRTGTVPALVPKPPSYPLVKLVGKFYTLKCRFCEVEFHGPLSVQEDWIRHLQQHILKMNYNKPAMARASSTDPPAQTDDPAPVQATVTAPAPTLALASTSSSTSTTPVLTSTPTHTTAHTVAPRPPSRSPTPPAESAPTVTATQIAKTSEEQPTLIPTPTHIPIPTQAK